MIRFVDDLGLPLVKDYAVWNYQNQVAGFIKVYDRLAFVTVKGSGHMVPEDKPGQALQILHNLIRN